MIKPKSLKKGDTIGIISPSYPYALKLKNRYERAKENLKKKGFTIIEGEFVYSQNGYATGTPKERAKDINMMFSNSAIAAIFFVNGGSVASEVLPYLDYELIKKNPKIIIGYSDAVPILLAIHTKTQLITFSGPMIIPQFGEFPSILDYSWESLQNMLITPAPPTIITASAFWTDEFLDSTKNEDLKPRKKITNQGYVVVNHGVAKGQIICANLRLLCSLIGTAYVPSLKNKILVLEDVSIGTDEIERNLMHLELSGNLDAVAAIVFGRILGLKEKDGVTLQQVLTKLCPKNIPIITEFDYGHTDPIVTLPNGAQCQIDTHKKQLCVYRSVMG